MDNAGKISNDKRIVSIAAGEEHTVALRADGCVLDAGISYQNEYW